MISDADRIDLLARAQKLRQSGESARRRDDDVARRCYEESVALLRDVGEPLPLAHAPFRHLAIYIMNGDMRWWMSAVLRRPLAAVDGIPGGEFLLFWLVTTTRFGALPILGPMESGENVLGRGPRYLYTTLQIEPGMRESTARLEAFTAQSSDAQLERWMEKPKPFGSSLTRDRHRAREHPEELI